MCINVLNFGMTYEQFWNTDLSAYYIFIKSYEKKRDRIIEDMDILSWQIGGYVIGALHCKPISVIMPATTTDTKKSCIAYPKTPISLQNKISEPKKSKARKIVTTPPTAEEEKEYREFLSSIKNK